MRVFVIMGMGIGACLPLPATSPRPQPAPGARSPKPGPARFTKTPYPSLQSLTLPSGLLVVLEHDPYAKVAGVVSVISGGASADPVGAEGLAHLVEHLTFRAVDPGPEQPLPLSSRKGAAPPQATRRERLVHHAAFLTNGLTSPDEMTFFEFAPPSRLPWLIDLAAARLSDPLAGLTPAAFALERRTIASEHELRDDPRLGQRASRQLFPLLFPSGHAYSRPVAGTSKSRERLTLAQARAFASENFRPERMTCW